VGFDAAGNLHSVSYQTFILGLQYWFPGKTGLSLAGTYSHLQSFNAATLANGAKNVVVRQEYASGAVFWDAVKAIRFGLEYAWLHQDFTAGGPTVDRRVQLSGWYVF
jgi:hypothetical protein